MPLLKRAFYNGAHRCITMEVIMFDPNATPDVTTVKPNYEAGDYPKKEFVPAPGGHFLVVNTGLQWQLVGAKRTKKLRITSRILNCFRTDDGSSPEKWIEKAVFWDIWWTLDKAYNARVLSALAKACGCTAPFDPHNEQDLTRILTGVPFEFRYTLEWTEGNNGKKYSNVRVDPDGGFVAIPPQMIEQWKRSPGWAKVPPAHERWKKLRDWSVPMAPANATTRTAPPQWAETADDVSVTGDEDDDLPF